MEFVLFVEGVSLISAQEWQRIARQEEASVQLTSVPRVQISYPPGEAINIAHHATNDDCDK